jgi:hypothetical protein
MPDLSGWSHTTELSATWTDAAQSIELPFVIKSRMF